MESKKIRITSGWNRGLVFPDILAFSSAIPSFRIELRFALAPRRKEMELQIP